MSAQAFVDESIRGSAYYVCVAIIANGDVDGYAARPASCACPGQRRWHFVHERNSRRKQIVDAPTNSGKVHALIFRGRGRDAVVRPGCFRRMVDPLIEHAVGRLVTESPARTRPHRP